MITRSEGQQRVYEQVNASYRGDNGPLVIIEDLTVDREYGWVFCYDAKKHVETGDFKYAVAGNAPVLVEKQTGRLVSLGTGRPVDYYLAEYEARSVGRAQAAAGF